MQIPEQSLQQRMLKLLLKNRFKGPHFWSGGLACKPTALMTFFHVLPMHILRVPVTLSPFSTQRSLKAKTAEIPAASAPRCGSPSHHETAAPGTCCLPGSRPACCTADTARSALSAPAPAHHNALKTPPPALDSITCCTPVSSGALGSRGMHI